jgi:RNA polymerase sigma-70 factor (ECF subfamily)
MEETELLLQLKRGNQSAYGELVSAYQKTVLNICYRFLLNREDAEDVSQEVFVEVYHSIKNFREDSKLSTWIYRIAVTKSLDEIKRQSRKKRISSIGKTLGIEKIVHLVSGTDRPDRTLEEKEALSLLMCALNKLHESQRIALTLSKIEGYSNTEIAEIMQTSLTAVDSLIYRAKQNLKEFLNHHRQNLK